VSFEVNLEEHGALTVGKKDAMVTLDSKGTWSFQGKNGNLAFAPKQWHTVALNYGTSQQTVTVDGKVVCNVLSGSSKAKLPISLSLDRYIFASFDNFAVVNSTSQV